MAKRTQVNSKAQIVADGLAIELLESLDLKYQVVPDYDEQENVVTGWDGDQFLYLVAFNKLPPGWINACVWIEGFSRDIQSASKSGSFNIVDCGCLQSGGGFDLSYILISYTLTGEDEPITQLVCHMTDHLNAYSAYATPVSELSNEQLGSEVLSILKTAHSSSSNVIYLNRKKEERYIGYWHGSYVDDLHRNVEVGFHLMRDLTFVSKEIVEGERHNIYSGVWSITKNVISWEYLYGGPASQKRKTSEVDEIRRFTGDTLLLVSQISGRELFMRRTECIV